MRISISDLSDIQVVAIAEQLKWKATNPAKIRGALSLNLKAMRVRAAIQEEQYKAEVARRSKEILEEVEKNPKGAVSFGTSEEAAAKHIVDTFGLVPRMAKRAINRGIARDEYHGRGYVVKVTDVSEDTFDIQVYAA